MKNPYEHIHWATNARLAEMLTESMVQKQGDYSPEECIEICKEAALRLKNFDKAPRIPFNHEQFE